MAGSLLGILLLGQIHIHIHIRCIAELCVALKGCTDFILFIYFWLRWVFVAACGLSLVAVSGGFSCCRAWALGVRASVVVACGLSSGGSWALERRLSSCGARA